MQVIHIELIQPKCNQFATTPNITSSLGIHCLLSHRLYELTSQGKRKQLMKWGEEKKNGFRNGFYLTGVML